MLVDSKGRTRLVDVGEFEANRIALGYPPDVETLAWVNRHYLKAADRQRLVQLALPYLREAGWVFAPGPSGIEWPSSRVATPSQTRPARRRSAYRSIP